MATVSGHAAVVSIKPVVSDTGNIAQAPGQEYLHIAVRYVDGTLLATLKDDYLLDDLQFSGSIQKDDRFATSELLNKSGAPVGYLVWRPYRPGTAVLVQIAPVLTALILIALAALAVLMGVLRRRSLKLRKSEAHVRHLAHHDQLTGLVNRSRFYAILDDVLREKRRTRDSVAVLYLDLDMFKEVNDTFGHPAGDELLGQVALRLQSAIGANDEVGRIGGDEFAIMLRSAELATSIESVCDRIVELARHPFDIAGTQVFIGVSIGVAVAPRDGFDRVELMRRADVALYRAKLAGRSGYAVYMRAMDDLIDARRDIGRDLRKAIDSETGLDILYQPLVSASDGRIEGVEALLRWHHPARGAISPDVFIPIAEESGLIDRLGEWVLRNACKTAGKWKLNTVAVNVSAIELRSPGYAARVANIIMATGFDPRRLELEVTESALADKGGQCHRNITALRELGVRFALDDFGTGFSSLGRLHELSVDRIKIDRSFVQGFGKSNGDEAIVKAIVDLARGAGLRTTAEGVETVTQSEYLKSLGCDDLQGYLLSLPLSAEEMSNLLKPGLKRQSA